MHLVCSLSCLHLCLSHLCPIKCNIAAAAAAPQIRTPAGSSNTATSAPSKQPEHRDRASRASVFNSRSNLLGFRASSSAAVTQSQEDASAPSGGGSGVQIPRAAAAPAAGAGVDASATGFSRTAAVVGASSAEVELRLRSPKPQGLV
jgi:hypothetical protein